MRVTVSFGRGFGEPNFLAKLQCLVFNDVGLWMKLVVSSSLLVFIF
jgi:hypothetical protein